LGCYTSQHRCYGGIDRHVAWMYLGVLDADEVRSHESAITEPESWSGPIQRFLEYSCRDLRTLDRHRRATRTTFGKG
jgi:hypothetical protein